MFIKVENNNVIGEPVSRPKLSIAYLGIPTDDMYLNEGWYRCVYNEYPEFNNEIHVYGEDQYIIQGNTVLINRNILDRNLSAVINKFKQEVDEFCARKRSQYITTTAGQELVYAAKLEEAKECLTDSSRTALKYPLVNASVGVNFITTGNESDDLISASNEIIDQANQWKTIGAQIENLRLLTKANLNKSSDVNQAYSAIQGFRDAPL